MIDADNIKQAFLSISMLMDKNKEYLIELDQQNGDGDLGISMSNGFGAVAAWLKKSEETDLGKIFLNIAGTFNEAAPSSLGTILSFAFMGMAQNLVGETEIDLKTLVDSLQCGIDSIMQRAGSRPGEKTILDTLCPAVEAMRRTGMTDEKATFEAAYRAAETGALSTRNMEPVHGRAAYYKGRDKGFIDGGSVVGKLIFEAIDSMD